VEFVYPKGISDEFLANGKCMLCGNNMFTKVVPGVFGAPPAAGKKCSCTCPNYGSKCPIPESEQQCWPLPYLHMNHFFMHRMWKEPALKDVDFFMRVDADLYVQRELGFDVFESMAKKNCHFATGASGAEAPGCYEGQHEAALAWAQKAKAGGMEIYPENLANEDPKRPNEVYWGGFHAGDARMFKHPNQLAFSKHITELGGVYTHRWSDQLHFPLVTRLFTKDYSDGEEQGSTGPKGVCYYEFFKPGVKYFHHEHRGSDTPAFWNKCTSD